MTYQTVINNNLDLLKKQTNKKKQGHLTKTFSEIVKCP